MLKDIFTNSAVGLESTEGTIKLAKVSCKGSNITLETLQEVAVENLPPLDEELIATALSDPLVRPLKMVLQKEKEIDEALEFQIEPHLPFPLDEAIINRSRIRSGEDGTVLTVLAAREGQIKEHLQKWGNLSIDPEIVTTTPIALANFCRHFIESKEPIVAIHIGESFATCALIKEGKLLTAKTIAEKSENSIYRLFLSLQKVSETPKQILYTGEMHQTLKEKIDLPEVTPEHQAFAVPVGIALSALQEPEINFRKKACSHPDPWKRIKKPLVATGLLTLLFSFSLYLFGNAYLSHREEDLKNNYVQLLSMMRKPYSDFESSFSDTVSPPIELTTKDLSERIDHLENELKESPDSFALYPNTPKVADLLAWLTTHPLVTDERLQLKSLSYKMIKRPERNKLKERYQVKVDLDFTAEVPRHAREFHDMLLAPNDFLDPNQEVGWNTRGGVYRASFFLKDLTRYPR